MRPLYEIDKDIEACILEGTDFETGEFRSSEALEGLQMEREKKIEGVCLYLKDTVAEAAAIREEICALSERENKLNRSAEGMKVWLAMALNGEKFSTPKCECSFRKSEAVVYEDEKAVKEYLIDHCHELSGLYTYDYIFKPIKSEIKKYLKAGNEIPGVSIETRQNVKVI